jgi:tetratricopeptide (TPR) repeat protein
LQQAVLQSTGKAQIPANAKESALKAINLGLNNPQAVAAAHQIAGRYDLDRNKLDSALDHYSRAIGALQSTDNPDLLISLFYHRALTQRRKEQYQFAYQDIQQALQLARQSNSEGSIKFLNEELETIKSHAGRPLDQFTIPPEKFEQPTKDE